MGSTGIGVLIAITLGTTYAGYPYNKKPESSFQKNTDFLEGYDSMKTHLFNSPESGDQKNKKAVRYTMVYYKGSPDEEKGSYNNVNEEQDTQKGYSLQNEPDYEIIPMTEMKTTNQNEQLPPNNNNKYNAINNRNSYYTQLFGSSNNISQKPYRFPSPEPIVQHMYDSPKESIQGDNWYESPQASMSLMESKSPNDNGVNYEHIFTKLMSAAMAKESSGEVSGIELDAEKNSGKKPWVEHTKPYEIEVVKKTGVPKPHLVKIPVPQVVKAKTPQPYAIYEAVPVPVAIPIYKLVPEVIEKKVPIEVEKLVPVYKDKPYNVTMEKIHPVYVKKPYPVYETIYKHVYRKSKPSYSEFIRRHPKHLRSRGW